MHLSFTLLCILFQSQHKISDTANIYATALQALPYKHKEL